VNYDTMYRILYCFTTISNFTTVTVVSIQCFDVSM